MDEKDLSIEELLKKELDSIGKPVSENEQKDTEEEKAVPETKQEGFGEEKNVPETEQEGFEEEKTIFDYSEEEMDEMILGIQKDGENYLEEKYGRPFHIYRSTPGRSTHPGCVIGYATPTENEAQNFRMIFVPDSGLISDEFVNSCAEEKVKEIFEKSVKSHFEKYVVKVDVNGRFCNCDDPEVELSTYLRENPEKQFRIYFAVDAFELMETTPETIYENISNAVAAMKQVKGTVILSYVDEEKLAEILQYMNFFTKVDSTYEEDLLEGFLTQELDFSDGQLLKTVEDFVNEYVEV